MTSSNLSLRIRFVIPIFTLRLNYIMKITVQYDSDFVYHAKDEAGNQVRIDMRPNDKTDLNPTQLLLAGVGACSAVDIVLILKKMRKTVADFQVEVDGQRRAEHPKYFDQIQCKFILTSPDTNHSELEKVAQKVVEKYCSVASSLRTPIDLICEVVN